MIINQKSQIGLCWISRNPTLKVTDNIQFIKLNTPNPIKGNMIMPKKKESIFFMLFVLV
jgi:hypothetical protein